MHNAATLGAVSHRYQFAGAAVSLVTHDGGRVLPRHAHSASSLTVVLGGEYGEDIEGRYRVVPPMNAALKPAGILHSNKFGRRGALCLLIELQATTIESLVGASAALEVPRTVSSGPASTSAIELALELRREPLEPLAVESLTAECLSFVARQADLGEPEGSASWLSRIRDVLHDPHTTRLGIRALAAEVGYHPAYVSRAFRRRFGISIGQYARRVRLARTARALVVDTDCPLSSIALAAGYQDHSHMSNDFRARIGTTPSDWRRFVIRRD